MRKGKVKQKLPKNGASGVIFFAARHFPGFIRIFGLRQNPDGAACGPSECARTMENQQLRDEKFMRLALNEAQKALEEQEVPIGAVVVSGDTVVGRGHNLVETLSDPTAHAEMQALTAASSTLGGKYLKDCTLYVTVEPCIMCAGAIGWAQVSRVVWGADDPKKGYRRYSESVFHPRTTVERGVLREECETLLRGFFAGLRP